MSKEIEIFEQVNELTLTDSKNQFPSNLPPEVHLFNLSQAKRVNKPWGFEIWIADGSNKHYAYKIIGIRAGHQTSLQYHDKKQEDNFLLSGNAILHYQDVETGVICQTGVLTPGHVIEVVPKGVHRIQAVTDIILIEASTTELDDVVRLQDDTNRPDGKIDSEHR